jgi:thiol-disulfide isomerase/thioredoxin
MTKILFAALLSLAALVPRAQSLPALAPLPGEHFSWKGLHTPLVVIVFLSTDCPICQGYTGALNTLQARYAGQVSLVGVFPGKTYSDSACLAFRAKYAIRFPLLKDRSRALVRRLKATITPEAFLLDASRRTLYQGAIDDKVVSLGKSRFLPSHRFLELAIAEAQAGKAVAIPRTDAVGCLINDY